LGRTKGGRRTEKAEAALPGHIFLGGQFFAIIPLFGGMVFGKRGRMPFDVVVHIILLVFVVAPGEFVVIVFGHQIGLNMVDDVLEVVEKPVEILLVQKDLMPLVAVSIKLSGALG